MIVQVGPDTLTNVIGPSAVILKVPIPPGKVELTVLLDHATVPVAPMLERDVQDLIVKVRISSPCRRTPEGVDAVLFTHKDLIEEPSDTSDWPAYVGANGDKGRRVVLIWG